MRMHCDALVVGSGISALAYAIEVAEAGRQVVIVTKRAVNETNTMYAQGGIAAVLSPEDSIDAHVQDTLKAGAGLCHPQVVTQIVRESRAAVERLIAYGVNFDPGRGGSEYDLTREGGHSQRRVIHAGDVTGSEVMRGLLAKLRDLPNVNILEDHCAVDLLTERRLDAVAVGAQHRPPRTSNRCVGAYVLDVHAEEVHTITANAVMLASGGASKVYLYTSNPDIATGDGVAMAWRAGAEVANMEFIQFHPTCLFHPRAKSFLISEALRGEGGRLVRQDGTRFMEDYAQKELEPRDVVARAIDSELKRTGDDCVFLDMTHLPRRFLTERFPTIHETCLGFGIDLTKEPIPVVPAAHYVCGGVRCSVDGATSLPGLFVAGEVACSGMHGANRLASNSLLEGAVIGHRAARASEELFDAPARDLDAFPEWQPGRAVPPDELVVLTHCWDEIRRLMWNYVGIVRSDRRLHRARRRLETLAEEIREFYWNATVTRDIVELRNIQTVASLIVDCALRRKESRGLHFTLDYPELSSGHPQDTILKRADLI